MCQPCRAVMACLQEELVADCLARVYAEAPACHSTSGHILLRGCVLVSTLMPAATRQTELRHRGLIAHVAAACLYASELHTFRHGWQPNFQDQRARRVQPASQVPDTHHSEAAYLPTDSRQQQHVSERPTRVAGVVAGVQHGDAPCAALTVCLHSTRCQAGDAYHVLQQVIYRGCCCSYTATATLQ